MRNIKKVKELKNGGLRYNNVRIDRIPSETMKGLVTITKGPEYSKLLWGKKFVNVDKAVKAIDVIGAENLINRGYIDPACVVSLDNRKVVVMNNNFLK